MQGSDRNLKRLQLLGAAAAVYKMARDVLLEALLQPGFQVFGQQFPYSSAAHINSLARRLAG